MKTIFTLFIANFFVLSANAVESLKGDHIKVSWLAPSTMDAAEQTLAIDFQIDPKWHIYWRNPGDSGAAPKFNFVEGSGAVGPIQWPSPTRLPLGDLVNIGYENEVAFPFTFKPSGDKAHVEVKLEWLVCQEECIPGLGTLSLDRTLHAGGAKWNAAALKKLNQFTKRVPQVQTSTTPFQLSAVPLDSTHVRLTLTASPPTPSGATPKTYDIFPLDNEALKAQAPTVSPTPTGAEFVFEVVHGKPPIKQTGFMIDDGTRAWELPTVAVTTAVPVNTEGDSSLWFIFLSALIGGMILNFMPCVLPVLSIKFLSLAKAEHAHRAKESLLYAAGVIVTFVLLGGIFLGLRFAGSAIGWGFQLQSPPIVLSLVLLFWLMGLNFLGFFEIGISVMNAAGEKTRRSGSFATGILSVFVAAPCTGPFMGTALGAASTLPSLAALGIFLCLGIGLSAPFLVFAAKPELLRFMPKPGAWMETLKQFFAFPLFATVIWLMWVLGIQAGAEAWLIGATLLLAITFAIWIGRSRGRVARTSAWIFALLTLVVAGKSVRELEANASGATVVASHWNDYSEEQVFAARAAHQAVFIDFTAAWCISCQVNKRAVLETTRGEALFDSHNVLLLKADWTKQDPKITQALAAFGRNSVPVYVFYAADGSPAQILPQILTFATIEDLFNQRKL